MKNASIATGIALSIASVCGTASAAMSTGTTYNVTQNSAISVQFLSQSAGATGNLYYLGKSSGGPITYAANTDAHNLGQYLFTNHIATAGYSVGLGNFLSGDILHFAYKITNGSGNAPTGATFRTDVAADLLYYGHENLLASGGGATIMKFGIEDIRGNSSDWDYNDLIFSVTSTPNVPAPGPVVLAGLAGLIAMPRSRRK